jgi:hypothetical protein
MTVQDVINILKQLPPNMIAVMKDSSIDWYVPVKIEPGRQVLEISGDYEHELPEEVVFALL